MFSPKSLIRVAIGLALLLVFCLALPLNQSAEAGCRGGSCGASSAGNQSASRTGLFHRVFPNGLFHRHASASQSQPQSQQFASYETVEPPFLTPFLATALPVEAVTAVAPNCKCENCECAATAAELKRLKAAATDPPAGYCYHNGVYCKLVPVAGAPRQGQPLPVGPPTSARPVQYAAPSGHYVCTPSGCVWVNN